MINTPTFLSTLMPLQSPVKKHKVFIFICRKVRGTEEKERTTGMG